MGPEDLRSFNIGDAKKRFSELVGRVAFGGERVLITRRGKPMAKLVPADEPGSVPHLADVRGWLDDEDPFFALMDGIVASRSKHRPRVLPGHERRLRTKRP